MSLPQLSRSYNYSYQETSTKQPPLETMCEPHMSTTKPHSFLSNGNVLYPCPSNNQALQQQLANDNRMLWAALTPHGTRHFVSEKFPIHDDHYEVIEYENNQNSATVIREPASTLNKRTPIKVIRLL